MAKKSSGPFDFGSALKSLRKEVDSQTFDESSLSEVGTFYDTGCYALNRIISGKFKGGIPSGRTCILFGESQCVPDNQRVKILTKLF